MYFRKMGKKKFKYIIINNKIEIIKYIFVNINSDSTVIYSFMQYSGFYLVKYLSPHLPIVVKNDGLILTN